MYVNIRTLKSQDAVTVQVNPSESVGAFKKRCASMLPYNGNCILLLRGQTIPKKSLLSSLDIEPHDFLVAIPTAGKVDSTPPALNGNEAFNATVFAEPAAQLSSSSANVASARTHQQPHSSTSTTVPVTLPSAPYTLLPGYVSRPQALDPIHPLPSEPITAAASLQSTGPSLGAWAPKAAPPQPHGHDTAETLDKTPSQSGLWADLAAELRSAPIAVPSQPLQAATSAQLTAGLADAAIKSASKSNSKATAASESMTEDTTAHHPTEATAKQARRARCKLIPVEPSAAPATANGVRSTNSNQKTQGQKGTRAAASKGKAKGRAATNAPDSRITAPDGARHAEAEVSKDLQEDTASNADPARQAKNAAFKGSGALGLSRRLSSRLLTPQEVNVMAKLPLPPVLQKLEEVLFPPVNGMYGFLLRQHIQPTWRAIKSAARNAPGGNEVQLEDVQTMAELCPDVVILRDPQQIQSPNKSIRQWRKSVQAEKAPPSLVNPIDAEDATGQAPSGPGEAPSCEANQAHPMQISTDGAGTVFGGQARQDRLVVEIMDPGRKTIGSTSLAEMGVDEDATIQEVGMDARSLAARLPSRRHDGAAGQSEPRKGQTDRGAKNAQQRRVRAFRQSLVRAVVPSHQALLRGLHQQQQQQQHGQQQVHKLQQPKQQDEERDQKPHSRRQAPVACSDTQQLQPHPGAELASSKPCPQAVRSSPHKLTQTKKASAVKAGTASEAKQAHTAASQLPQGQAKTPEVDLVPKAAEPAVDVPADAGEDMHEEWDIMARKAWHPLFKVEELSLDVIKCNLIAARDAEAAKEPQSTSQNLDEELSEKAPARPPQVARKHEPCLDTTHMCTNQFLKHVQQLGWYADQIVHMEDLPARQPQYALPTAPLSEPVQAALAARGINQMFTHQAKAVDAVMAGKNVVVSTSTASGKSLCYNIPILEALVQDRRACALYMFPTKALAQDQLRALRHMCAAAFGDDAPHVEVYDGDTVRADRGDTRDRAQLLITNPDMLHRSILPVHSQFSRILAHLRYIVVDEGHAYKGVFGCHTAFVLRRLRRLCERFYRSRPTFVVTSATVANPKEHVQELLGVEQVEVISEDGSPHGPKCFVLWNPPLTVSQQALNKGSQMKMSRTEGRARLTKGGISKRAKQEYVREELRDANQARGRGSQMGGPEGGLASVNETEWLSEVRAGRKKAAVLKDAEKVFQAVEASKGSFSPSALPGNSQQAHQASRQATTAAANPSADTAAAEEHHMKRNGYGVGASTGSSAAGASSNGNALPHRSSNAVSHSDSSRTEATNDNSASTQVMASNTASAMKRELQRQNLPEPKRQKMLSKESQAAMAVIAATARLPSQAPSMTANNIKYLHSEQPQNRPVIRRQLPSLTALPENIFRPGTTSGSNPHMSGLAQGAFGGSRRQQGEAEISADEQDHSVQLPQSSDGLQLTRVDQDKDSQAQTDEEAREQIQDRLPGADWKARIGAAGTPMEQQRVSPIVELSMLLAECIQHGLRTLAFCKTRKLCELVTAYTRETLKNTAPHLAKSISVYRAGYSPQERREIEAALHDGQLWAVAATNALELGVDVGSLDVTLHLGFPGSVASLWQQAGRAGRREQPSTSIYIAFDGPLDQFFMKQPDKLFGRAIECAQVDANNPQLLEQHVCCACAEMPVTEEEDGCYFGPGLSAAMDSLVAQSLVSRHPHTTNVRALFYSGVLDTPAAAISLRAIDPERYAIVNEEDGDIIEEIEESKAFYEVYDGAVYMFQGRTYLCKKLDLGSKVAMVRSADLKYYTKTRDFTDVHVVGGHTAYPVRVGNDRYPTTTACCDAAIVTVRWLGFHRIWQSSGEVFDSIDLFLPDVQFGTQAAYIRVPRAARKRVKDAGLPFRDGLHAASHALLNVVPLYMMCNATDMAAECDNPYDTRFRPERLLLYDKHPGGIGIAAQATPLFSVLLEKALELIENCNCKPASGCPGCVQHTDCGEYNAVLNKFSAIIVLQCTIEAEAEHRERLRLQQQVQLGP